MAMASKGTEERAAELQGGVASLKEAQGQLRDLSQPLIEMMMLQDRHSSLDTAGEQPAAASHFHLSMLSSGTSTRCLTASSYVWVRERGCKQGGLQSGWELSALQRDETGRERQCAHRSYAGCCHDDYAAVDHLTRACNECTHLSGLRVLLTHSISRNSRPLSGHAISSDHRPFRSTAG